MFGLLKRWRRRRVLARHFIPEAPWREAVRAVPALARLEPEALGRLRSLALLFLHEKSIEPAGGMVLDDVMRVRLAALACLPILELGLDCYDGFVSVVVYPGEFMVRDREEVDEVGVVHVGDDVLSGEAWQHGPVVLAWADIEASGRGDGYNVVAHEFAHKLDALEGAVNGMPPLPRRMRPEEWSATFQAAYDDLVERLERGEETWLDPYAAESPAEFFAVCTELFFDTPEALVTAYPELYAQLSAFYRQDPARRRCAFSASSRAAGAVLPLLGSLPLLLLAPQAPAHHSVAAEFDVEQRVTLRGVMTHVDWINPHINLYLEARDEAGEVTLWRLSSLPPAVLRRVGLTPDVLMGGGALIEVEAVPAREGTPHLAWVLTLRYPDGHHYRLSGTGGVEGGGHRRGDAVQ